MAVEIDHLGIAVRDLDESLRFYTEALGMEAGNARDGRCGAGKCGDVAGGDR